MQKYTFISNIEEKNVFFCASCKLHIGTLQLRERIDIRRACHLIKQVYIADRAIIDIMVVDKTAEG